MDIYIWSNDSYNHILILVVSENIQLKNQKVIQLFIPEDKRLSLAPCQRDLTQVQRVWISYITLLMFRNDPFALLKISCNEMAVFYWIKEKCRHCAESKY